MAQRWVGVLTAVVVAIGIVPGSAAWGVTSGNSFVVMVSARGTAQTDGEANVWLPGSGTVSLSGSQATGAKVEVSGGPSASEATLEFWPATGRALTEGTYETTKHYRNSEGPAMRVTEDVCAGHWTGHFTILDMAPDMSRLHLRYELQCTGSVSRVFGEIRVNVPGADPELVVAPGQVSWPATYPGALERVLPVTLVNVSSRTLSVDSAAVVAGREQFLVDDNDCSNLPPGGTCAVMVEFRPVSPGAHSGELVITSSAGSGTDVVKLSGEGIAGHTSWEMASQEGDWVGAGLDWFSDPTDSTNPDNATWGTWGTNKYVQIYTFWYGHYFHAEFAPGQGEVLSPGSTFDATRYPFNDEGAGMGISGDRRGCNSVTGTFTVEEAEYSPSGEVEKFAVTFEQHCEGRRPALFGSIAYRADDPAAPVPGVETTPPAAVSGLRVKADGVGATTIAWQNPADEDWASTAVLRSNGGLDYDGQGRQVRLGRLVGGRDRTYTIVTRDYWSNVSDPVTFTLRGTELSLRATDVELRKGERTTLRGRLVHPASGQGLRNRPIVVKFRLPGIATWHHLTTVTTDARGRFSLSRRPDERTIYAARFLGAGSWIGSASSWADVAVATD